MPDQPPPLEAVRALVRSVIQYAPEQFRALLLAQAERLEYVGGPITMMELRVTGDCAPAHGVKGPLPGGPSVVGADDDAIGLLLLWLDASGYIDCLEYGWFTDDMPTELPSPSQ